MYVKCPYCGRVVSHSNTNWHLTPGPAKRGYGIGFETIVCWGLWKPTH